MKLSVILNLLITILVLLGYLITWILNRQKLTGFWLFVFVSAALLAPGVVWVQYVIQEKESEKQQSVAADIQKGFTEVKEQYELLHNENDSVKARLDEMSKREKELRALLEPFTKRAMMSYPGFNEREALQKLGSDISKMHPKIVFLGQTEPQQDSVTDLLHTAYAFRSQYPVGIRDIQIKVRFNRRFVAIGHDIRGAIVEEQGTRMTVHADSSGFSYTTGYLREGNDIVIQVTSRKPLDITSMELFP